MRGYVMDPTPRAFFRFPLFTLHSGARVRALKGWENRFHQEYNLAMNKKIPPILLQNKNILLIALAVALILLVPLFAMQVTSEVSWGPFDFLGAGVLLFGTGLAFELVTRKSDQLVYRLAVGVALLTALFLVWSNLAVGIIGSEDDPINLLYFGVLAVAAIGALIARLRPGGMARALFATALAQVLVTLIALIVEPDPEVLEILMANGFFIVLWVGSAWLFLRADATTERQSK